MLTVPLPISSILGNSSPGPTRTQLEMRKDREISTRNKKKSDKIGLFSFVNFQLTKKC